MRALGLLCLLWVGGCDINGDDKSDTTETQPDGDDPADPNDPTDPTDPTDPSDPNHPDNPANNPNNQAPSAPEISLTPAQPTSNDELRANIVFDAVDPDGDPVSYLYAWLIDGVPVPNESGATLPVGYTSRDQEVEVRVRATDTVLQSGSVAARVTILNGLPSVTAAWSQPSYAGGEQLQVVATGEDPDADAVTLSYAWRRNGQNRNYSGAVVPGSDVSAGQVWEVTIEPRDQAGAGRTTTLQTTIANQLPQITSVVITPSSPGVRNNLTATVAASDPDGQPVTLSYRWFVNSNQVQASGSPSLSSSFTSLGDSVTVEATPSDGIGTGTPVLSAPVLVSNRPPSQPVVALRPATPDTCGALVCRITQPSVDPDGDPVTLTFGWLRNGAPYTGATATTNRPGDTIAVGQMVSGDAWTCQVTASDGTASAPVATASGTVADTLRTDQFSFVPADAADILFIVDDSGSMAEEQGRLSSLGPTFMSLVTGASTNYHIGVITTDTTATARSGKLVTAGGLRYLTNLTPNAASLFSQMVVVGTNGSADERGRRAAELALTAPLVSGYNNGFYRQDAHLSVIVLSDEDDVSGNNPTINEFVTFLQGLKAPPYTVGFFSLVGPSSGTCATASPGTGYLAVSAALGSTTRSICAADWEPLLEDAVEAAFNALPSFSLSAWPAAGTLQVVVDDPSNGQFTLGPTGYTYDSTSNRVTLRNVPSTGSTVTITYDVDCSGGPVVGPGDTDGDTGIWQAPDTGTWIPPFDTELFDSGWFLDSALPFFRPTGTDQLFPFP